MSNQTLLSPEEPQLDARLGDALDTTHTPESIPAPAPADPEPLSMLAVLRVRTIRRLWYAQIVSVLGDFLALFAVITVMTFNLNATPQQITGVQIAYLLPIALLGVISGVFVDRWPVKPTLVCSDLLRAVLCLLLLAVHNIYGFYAVLAAISVISSFFGPAQYVAIRGAVPQHGYRSANALMQQVMFIMRILGPSAAAFLVARFGAQACYAFDTVSFLASASLIGSLAILTPRRDRAAKAPAHPIAHIVEDMREGAAFILHHAALLFVIVALAAGMFVMGCFGPLIAVYVRDTLHASTRTFGVTSAMIGVGLLFGVNALNAFAKRMSNTLQVYCGLGGIAAGTALLGLWPTVAATVVSCLLIGFAAAGIIVPSQTLIQQETPAALMGRVGSTVMSAIFSAQIAGLVLSGILANVTSVRGVFLLCTAMLGVLILAGKLWMEPRPHTT